MRLYYLLMGGFYTLYATTLLVAPDWMGVTKSAIFADPTSRVIWASMELTIGALLFSCWRAPSRLYRFMISVVVAGFATALAPVIAFVGVTELHTISGAYVWSVIVGFHYLFLYFKLAPEEVPILRGIVRHLRTSAAIAVAPDEEDT